MAKTYLKHDSFGGEITLWFINAGSLRGSEAGGGIGLVNDTGPVREGTRRLLGRKLGCTDSTWGGTGLH